MEILMLTGTNNNDFECFRPRREDSHTICPSGRFHALKILPPDERVITSTRMKFIQNIINCTSMRSRLPLLTPEEENNSHSNKISDQCSTNTS